MPHLWLRAHPPQLPRLPSFRQVWKSTSPAHSHPQQVRLPKSDLSRSQCFSPRSKESRNIIHAAQVDSILSSQSCENCENTDSASPWFIFRTYLVCLMISLMNSSFSGHHCSWQLPRAIVPTWEGSDRLHRLLSALDPRSPLEKKDATFFTIMIPFS